MSGCATSTQEPFYNRQVVENQLNAANSGKQSHPADRKKRHIFCEAKKCAPFYVS
jgi:hypothetical protein